MKKNVIYFLKICVTAVILWFLFRNAKLGEFWAEIFQINLFYFAAAILIFTASWWLNTWKWSVVLKIFNFNIGMTKLFCYNLVGIFYNIALPGGKIAGDAVRAYQVSRDHEGGGEEKIRLAFLAFSDRGITMLALLIVASVFFVFGSGPAGYIENRALIGGFIIFMVLFGIIFLFSKWLDFIFYLLSQLPWAWAKKSAGFVFESFLRMRENKLVLLKSLFYAVLVVIVSAFSLYALVLGMSLRLSALTVIFFYSLAVLLIAIPITVAGIGLREGGLAYLFVSAGIPLEQALALSILNLSLTVILAAAGGLIEFKYHFIDKKNGTNV